MLEFLNVTKSFRGPAGPLRVVNGASFTLAPAQLTAIHGPSGCGKSTLLLCAGGLRSSTVISALKRHGLGNFFNVTGGMAAWVKAGQPVAR